MRLHTSGASAVGVVPLAALPGGANRRPKRSLHYADACGGALLACGSDGGAVYVFDVEQKALVDDYDKRHQVPSVAVHGLDGGISALTDERYNLHALAPRIVCISGMVASEPCKTN